MKKLFIIIASIILVFGVFKAVFAQDRGKDPYELSDKSRTFKTGRLEVTATAENLTVSLEGKAILTLPAIIAVDLEESPDRDLFIPSFTVEEDRCVWNVRSSNWEKKEYSLSVEGTAIVLRLKVQGKGRPGKIRYFPENPKTGQSLAYEVSSYFVPVAMGGAKALPQWRNTMESASIDMWYLAPPLLAFPFKGNFSGSCAVGLAPMPGKYNLDHFRCEFARFRDGLFSTDLLGYTEINGEYELPAILFTEGEDEYKALSAYSEWFYHYGGCQKRDHSSIPRWWQGPVFCGWGEQAHLSPHDRYAGANQKDYTTMMNRLDELNLNPTYIIIDDKWQGTYGELIPDPEKWPDLRAFVDAEHAKGRRVLLWIKLWNSEGLPPEECVELFYIPYGADPTSPAYRKRMEETIYRLLSSDPGCFNCDGFKIDFANVMPLGKNLKTHESGVYGIELLKRMMTLIYQSAKKVKPDCLINTSAAHPYFADVTDQGRLHDYNGQLRFLWEVREYRAKLFQAAFPGISIDTDDPSCTSKDQVMNYLRRAPELGAPVLYHLSKSKNFPLDDEDFKWLSEMWKEYSRKLDK